MSCSVNLSQYSRNDHLVQGIWWLGEQVGIAALHRKQWLNFGQPVLRDKFAVIWGIASPCPSSLQKDLLLLFLLYWSRWWYMIDIPFEQILPRQLISLHVELLLSKVLFSLNSLLSIWESYRIFCVWIFFVSYYFSLFCCKDTENIWKWAR